MTETSAALRLRSAARLAAVQALYQMEMSGRGAAAVADEFRAVRIGEGEGMIEADADFFSALLAGVVDVQGDIDRRLAGVLARGWKLDRIDATLRAILRAGGYELVRRPDVPAKVVIDEYVEVAKAFFDGPEPKFVNAALDACARAARPGEFAAA